MNNHVEITIPIPTELHHKLLRYCSKNGFKKNAVINKLIQDMLNEYTKGPKPPDKDSPL